MASCLAREQVGSPFNPGCEYCSLLSGSAIPGWCPDPASSIFLFSVAKLLSELLLEGEVRFVTAFGRACGESASSIPLAYAAVGFSHPVPAAASSPVQACALRISTAAEGKRGGITHTIDQAIFCGCNYTDKTFLQTINKKNCLQCYDSSVFFCKKKSILSLLTFFFICTQKCDAPGIL